MLDVNGNWRPSNSKPRQDYAVLGGTGSVASRIALRAGTIMKTYKKLYGNVCSLKNLVLAFRKAKKGKGHMQYVKDFESVLEDNLVQLKCELETLSYEPMPLRNFVTRDPKTRLISAPHFRDRIVHHALCNVIEPIFDRIFIYDSYASRKGKGTHAALRRLDCFKRKVSCNGRLIKKASNNNMVVGYYLKADIRHYFASVDHDTLLNIIKNKIKDENLLWLVSKVLRCYDQSSEGIGMPIGSLTSQLFANIYLNEMDYFVKHNLRARNYIRYMDDFIIMHESKEMLLGWKGKIADFLATIKLELHPEKSDIFPLHKGAGFLGYRIFYHYKLLKKSNLRAINKRLEKHKELYEKNEISYEKIMQSIKSWMAYARYANTYGVRRETIRKVNQLIVGERLSNQSNIYYMFHS